MRIALTGHSRIKRQPNLPSGRPRIRSAPPLSLLETLPRIGAEIVGWPVAVQTNIPSGPIQPG